MSTLSHDQIRRTGLPVALRQRLGVEPDGTPLAVDGIVGPRTRAAVYLDPVALKQAHPLVACALEELLAGAQEGPRNNTGPWPKKYMRGVLYPGAWCAGFVSWCLRQTYGEGTPYIRGARRLGLAVAEQGDVGKLAVHELEVGDLIIWNRDGPDPGRDPGDDWSGHVAIVAHLDGEHVWSIDGNRGPRGRVRIFRHDREDPAMPNGPFLFGARWPG